MVLDKFYDAGETEAYAGKSIVHFTDNQAVRKITVKGRGTPNLQTLARRIFLAARDLIIQLEVQLLPRSAEEMVLADWGSRVPLYKFQMNVETMAFILGVHCG